MCSWCKFFKLWHEDKTNLQNVAAKNIDHEIKLLLPPFFCFFCFFGRCSEKTFFPRYLISWALLVCFWEISLFICQQWQDNEYCFVQSLVCCVMICIMFDNGLRKNGSESQDNDIPHKFVETFNYRLCISQKNEKCFSGLFFSDLIALVLNIV